MAIDKATEAQILRYFHVEKWPMGTIARQLGIHRSCVDRIISQCGLPKAARAARPSIIDQYLPFILDTLAQFPTLTASRLYQMVCERGYAGSPDHFRHLIAHYRPRKQPEAYLRLKSLPGEQAQVDWGHFGYLPIGAARRALMGFVMVLSYSRAIFLRFYVDQRMGSFLHGHVSAFEAFGGCARVLLYANLKSAVLERQGQAIRFHPTLLELAAHYRFEPRPVAVARGNEKGRVERAIRYVRDSFFAGRTFSDLADLNDQAQRWCQGSAAQRPCPEDRSMSVAAAFATEQPKLLALPADHFPSAERLEAKVGKTPYLRFDGNDYSVPHQYVQRALSVLADPDQVRILDGATQIAQHRRCYDKGRQIEDPTHIQALAAAKAAARTD